MKIRHVRILPSGSSYTFSYHSETGPIVTSLWGTVWYLGGVQIAVTQGKPPKLYGY